MTNNTVIIGHRGWPDRFPDNTLAGFLSALEVVDGFELDVRRSADGKLVLSHDPDLAGRLVSETEWAELAEIDLGDGHHPALLDEVLASIPGMPVQLEIKNDPAEPGFEPDHRRGLEAAERARPGDMVTSFNPDTLRSVRRLFPEVPTGLLVEGDGNLLSYVEQCLDEGHSALVPDEQMIRSPLPEQADLEYHTYTVNDPHRAEELVGLGVSGIITNVPDVVGLHLRGEL